MTAKETPSMFDEAITTAREIGLLPRRENFIRYMEEEVAEYLLSHETRLGGEVRDISILAVRITNYDELVESMQPDELAVFLNEECFSFIVPHILNTDGAVDKFIEGGLQARFGVPLPTENNALSALGAALKIQEDVAIINNRLADRGKSLLQVAIGITSGPTFIGDIGTQDRLEYTMLGEPVTQSWRAASLCKDFATQILVDETTYERAKEGANFGEPHLFIDRKEARALYPLQAVEA